MSTLSDILNALSSATSQNAITGALNQLGTHLQNSSTSEDQVKSLLAQVQANPAMAPQIAVAISAVPGVPASVMALASQLPAVADNKIALVELVVQIQSAYTAATSQNTIGKILAGL